MSSRDVQAHRGPSWSSAEPPSRRASRFPPPTQRLRSVSLSHTPARALGRQNSGKAQLRRYTRAASGSPPGSQHWCWLAARGALQLASLRPRGRPGRAAGDAHPPPRRAPQGERAPRAGAHTRDRALLSRSLSRLPPRWAFKQLSDITSQGFFPPLLSRRPSISTCGGEEEEEGGKRKEEKAKARAFRSDHEYSCNKPTAPTNLP